MRLLEFDVNSQRITKNPQCDFSNIVAGTKNYLKASFTFSSEWRDCVLVASFWKGGKEYAQFIKNNQCEIPPEVLSGPTFSISITGQRGDYRITTNRVLVRQEVSR